MKKKAIFTITACSIAALLLTGVLIVGLANGGFGVSALLKEDEAPLSGSGRQYEYTWDPEESEVSGLDVEWINGSVEVKVGNSDLLRITEWSDHSLKEKEKLQLSSSGGTLKIKWNDQFIIFGIFHNERKDLLVELPRAVAEHMDELSCSNTSGNIELGGMAAQEIDISSTSGDLKLSELEGEEAALSTTSGAIRLEHSSLSETLDITTVSGSMELSGITADAVNLDTVSGAAVYSGSAREWKASSVSAPLTAELSNCPEKADLEAVSGSLTLAIPENPGFEVEYSSISGLFSSEFPVTGNQGKSGRALYAGGNSSFSFSTTSGDMKVLKAAGTPQT